MRKSGKKIDLPNILVNLGLCERNELLKIVKSIQAKGDLPQLQGYKITRKLGEGAMGTVYLAFPDQSDQQTALKILSKELVNDQEYRERFMREVKALKQLDHSNIVTLFDAGVRGGNVFYAMEFVNGPSLQKWIEVKKTLKPAYAVRMSR